MATSNRKSNQYNVEGVKDSAGAIAIMEKGFAAGSATRELRTLLTGPDGQGSWAKVHADPETAKSLALKAYAIGKLRAELNLPSYESAAVVYGLKAYPKNDLKGAKDEHRPDDATRSAKEQRVLNSARTLFIQEVLLKVGLHEVKARAPRASTANVAKPTKPEAPKNVLETLLGTSEKAVQNAARVVFKTDQPKQKVAFALKMAEIIEGVQLKDGSAKVAGLDELLNDFTRHVRAAVKQFEAAQAAARAARKAPKTGQA